MTKKLSSEIAKLALVCFSISTLASFWQNECHGAQGYDSASTTIASGGGFASGPSSGGMPGDSTTSASMAGPSIISPSGLSNREQGALTRQYQFAVRNKAIMLTGLVAGSSAASNIDLQNESLTLEEKLYRYFGVGVSLYKEGKLEESFEILQYILDNDPGNDYVKAYIDRVKKEIKDNNLKQQVDNRRQSAFLKRKTLEDFIRDGTDYFQNREYDKALLKFADASTLDPNNVKVKNYMEKLKTYYLKELRVENIVRKWEAGNEEQDTPNVTGTSKKDTLDPALLQNAEKILNDVNKDQSVHPADKNTDDQKMRNIILAKRAASLLEQAELESRVEDIVKVERYEDKKSSEFTLGPGDIIQISVRDHPELSGLVPLRLKGEIVLPLVNDIVIGTGLTVDELAEKITAALKRYVQDPNVNISIVDYKSKVFYILDEVSCTAYPITRANLTLRDALFIGDWGNNRALGRVIVIKPSKLHPIIKKVDAFDLIYRGNLENNIKIDNGDVIYVPMTIAAKFTKTVADSLGPIRAIRTARDEFLNLKWNETDYKSYFRMPRTYNNESQGARDLSTYGTYTDSIVSRHDQYGQ